MADYIVDSVQTLSLRSASAGVMRMSKYDISRF
jgi:hypothetical protein